MEQENLHYLVIASNPRVVFLDEMTTGLDYEARKEMKTYIKASVFYSILLPIIMLLVYYVGKGKSGDINGYFPYLVSITMISTAAGLSHVIVNFTLFMLVIGMGTVLYLEMATIIGLGINDPRNAQTIINGFIYLFVILSGSIFRFARGSIMGKVMLVFPNIHIGNLLHQLWNNCKISMCGLEIVAGYIIILLCIIIYLIKRERKKLLY